MNIKTRIGKLEVNNPFLEKAIYPKWNDKDLEASKEKYETLLREAVSWGMSYPGRKINTVHYYTVCPTSEMDEIETEVQAKVCREFGIPNLDRFQKAGTFEYG
jgi:hypothetical protein